MNKSNYKIWWNWNWRIQLSSIKSPISINDIDTNKIAASNKFPLGKQGFKYIICYNKK